MHRPLVSIITPTYNHSDYIAECIESVLRQTYTNWELIIVDDGSTDNTFEVARSFAEKDNRITAYTQQNKGIFKLAETYNFALKKSSGTYIAVLEGDDVWFSHKLDMQLTRLEGNPNAVLSWGKVYAASKDLKTKLFAIPSFDFSREILFNNPVKSALSALIYNNHLPALSVIIKKDILVSIGGFIQSHNLPLVDISTWQKCACVGTFEYMDEPLGLWRTSLNQATKTFNIEMVLGLKQLAHDLFSENEDFFKKANISLSKINNYYHARLVVNHYKLGIYSLKRGEREKAKKEFVASIEAKSKSKFIWKLKSMLQLWLIKFSSY